MHDFPEWPELKPLTDAEEREAKVDAILTVAIAVVVVALFSYTMLWLVGGVS